MSETEGPRFQLIRQVACCRYGFCFDEAKYWAIWDGMITITRAMLATKRPVCRAHRDAIEGKAWTEVSEDFRTNL
jgi:hypothetical protein